MQPVGCYQHIPADIGGDCGLEGFSHDGTAYQCYACQNWNDFGVLLDHQKNKMTEDIGKFLRKEAELMKIMGDIRIGIWNFILPFWNNKDLLKHARKKQDEVRKKKPKHIQPDFRISVITADEFAVEVQALAKQDLYQFDVREKSLIAWPRPQSGSTTIRGWRWRKISPGSRSLLRTENLRTCERGFSIGSSKTSPMGKWSCESSN